MRTYKDSQKEVVSLMVVYNLLTSVGIHLLYIFITLMLLLPEKIMGIYDRAQLEKLEKKRIAYRRKLTLSFPGYYKGF
jgi:hypothetical protein